jgi:hypothetical protein
MFVFSMVQDGPRGLQQIFEPVDEVVEDIASYGVDWQVANEPRLMQHLLEQNPQDWENENPFRAPPAQLSDVPCEPPNCPFTPEQVALLDETLRGRVDVTSRNMGIRRLVWQEAFHISSSKPVRKAIKSLFMSSGTREIPTRNWEAGLRLTRARPAGPLADMRKSIIPPARCVGGGITGPGMQNTV